MPMTSSDRDLFEIAVYRMLSDSDVLLTTI
jgi:hypothetical protein